MAITAGIYELRSMLQTAMAVDVAGASTTKGANVQLYSVNDTNAQKFKLVNRGDGWNLVNVSSAMYVDVDNYGTTDGTNIKQWTNNNNRAQRWEVTDTGETVIIDGVECIIAAFGSYVTTAHNMMMDVRWALTTDKTNIQLYHSNGTDAQRFALYPTTPLDKSLASPSNLGWVEGIGATDVVLTRFGGSTLYPCWQFPESWAPGTAAFEYCYRTREVEGNTTGSWSDLTAWTPAVISIIGQQAWLSAGVPAAVTGKALQYDFRIRSISGGAHSVPTTAILTAAYRPALTVTGATVAYDALQLTTSSDYADGTNTLFVDGIKNALGAELLSQPTAFGGLGTAGAAVIPIESLQYPVVAGEALTISYRVGTDLYSEAGNAQSVTVTAEAASGYGLDVTPTITPADGRALTVEPQGADTYRVFTVYSGGMIPAADNGDGTYTALYPFGEPFSVYVSGLSANGWGDSQADYAADEFGKPCHAWNWNGGWFLLQIVDGFMSTERSVSVEGDAASFTGREWQTVKYSDTLQGKFTAGGVIGRPIADSDKEQLQALALAHHVTYRAPTGEIAQVGIDNYSYSSTVLRTDVSVSMTQESI